MGMLREESERTFGYGSLTAILFGFFIGFHFLLLPCELLGKTPSKEIITKTTSCIDENNINLGGGFPWINFREGRALTESALLKTLGPTFEPLSLAAGRFDDDGSLDLAVGHGDSNGGHIVVYKGNIDSIYPNTTEARQGKANGTFSDRPFLSPIIDLEVPVAPSLMAALDFNGDQHSDLIIGSSGKSSLYVLFGNGHGAFEGTEEISLPGVVTAMIGGGVPEPIGFDSLAVAVSGPDGPQILIYDNRPVPLNTEPRCVQLIHKVKDLTWGRIDGDGSVDLVAVAGNEIVIVPGRPLVRFDHTGVGEEVEKEAVVRIALPFCPISVAVGDFIWDDYTQMELAVLSQEGSVHIFSGFDDLALDFVENFEFSALEKEIFSGESPFLVRANVSTHPSDDLVLVDPGDKRVGVIFGEVRDQSFQDSDLPQPFSIASFDFSEPLIAILPMRLNSDALSDLVVLHEQGEEGPSVLMTDPVKTFTVNSTGNQHDCKGGDGICNIKVGEDAQGNPICGGGCTLLAAITESGSNPGADLIRFSIPGSGPHTIDPVSFGSTVVPFGIPVVDSVTIDGTTEPDYVNKPIIEAGYYGLIIAAESCTVRGLVMNRATGIELKSNNNIIEGNFIGTDVTGTVAKPNTCFGVVVNRGNGNVIGGNELNARNIISGNDCGGIKVYDSHEATVIAKNFIGTDVTGKKGFTYSGIGVEIVDSQNVLVGGKTEQWGNIISGHSYGILILSDMSTTDTIPIQSNAIGSDVDGNALIGNALDGIVCQKVENVFLGGNLICGSGWVGSGPGGSTGFRNGMRISRSKDVTVYANGIGIKYDGTGILPNAECAIRIDESSNTIVYQNTITGNGTGVLISGSWGAAKNNEVAGNVIGMNKKGESCFGNAGDGVLIRGSQAETNKIWANVITGSGKIEGGTPGSMNGIHIVKSSNNTIRTNYIGTIAQGGASVQNKECGIKVENASDNFIGGATAEDGNIVSGNTIGVHILSTDSLTQYNILSANRIGTNHKGEEVVGNKYDGVVIEGLNATNNTVMNNTIGGNGTDSAKPGWRNGIRIENGSNNKIKGNFIGTNSEGEVHLANKGHGIRVVNSNGNMIGDIGYQLGNTAAFNGEDGVYIESGNKNSIRGNAIYENGGLGIDLGVNGVTAPGLRGANNAANWPVLNSASPYTGKTAIIGDLIASPNTTYHLDFYSNEACDPSGHGEGRKYIGSDSRTTDANGNKHFALTLDEAVPSGQFITATTTDPEGNTSEFSNCVKVSEARGDLDSDGVADIIEALAPNDGDGNGDGIPDDQQSNVASFLLINEKEYVTYEVSGECAAIAITNLMEEQSLETDIAFDYPLGVVGFSIPCETANLVTIYHEEKDLTKYAYRQYGPFTPGDLGTTTWYSLADYVGIEESRITINFKDNRLGDDTGDDGAILGKGGLGIRQWPKHR